MDTTYKNPATEEAREKQEEAKKKAANAPARAESTLAALMDLSEFREQVSKWLESCGLDAPIIQKNSNDREQALGKREIGLQIKKELEQASPEMYDLMVKEARARNEKPRSV